MLGTPSFGKTILAAGRKGTEGPTGTWANDGIAGAAGNDGSESDESWGDDGSDVDIDSGDDGSEGNIDSGCGIGCGGADESATNRSIAVRDSLEAAIAVIGGMVGDVETPDASR